MNILAHYLSKLLEENTKVKLCRNSMNKINPMCFCECMYLKVVYVIYRIEKTH